MFNSGGTHTKKKASGPASMTSMGTLSILTVALMCLSLSCSLELVGQVTPFLSLARRAFLLQVSVQWVTSMGIAHESHGSKSLSGLCTRLTNHLSTESIAPLSSDRTRYDCDVVRELNGTSRFGRLRSALHRRLAEHDLELEAKGVRSYCGEKSRCACMWFVCFLFVCLFVRSFACLLVCCLFVCWVVCWLRRDGSQSPGIGLGWVKGCHLQTAAVTPVEALLQFPRSINSGSSGSWPCLHQMVQILMFHMDDSFRLGTLPRRVGTLDNRISTQ